MEQLPRRFGRYMLLQQIGSGGMGAVYLAQPVDRASGIPTPLVIKVLKLELASDQVFVLRFEHEAQIATSIESPNVVEVYDVGQVDDALYIAMEHVPGWSLSKALSHAKASKRSFPLSWVRTVIAGALDGLGALHEARDAGGRPLSFIHRDVAPKNVMLGEGMVAKLIDLGIGKSSVQDWQTKTGVVMGTLGYMSPEQVLGRRMDHRTDLYSLAIVLFELLTVTKYIERKGVAETLRASVAPPIRLPSQTRSDVPPALDRVLERALAHVADARFATALELKHALLEALPERPTDRAELAEMASMLGEGLVESSTEIKSLALETLHDRPGTAQKTVTFAERIPRTAVEDVALQTTALVSRPMSRASAPAMTRRRIAMPVASGAVALAGMGLLAWAVVGRAKSAPEVAVVPMRAAPVLRPAPTPHAVQAKTVEAAPEPELRTKDRPIAVRERAPAPHVPVKPPSEEPAPAQKAAEPEAGQEGSVDSLRSMESYVDRLIARAQSLRASLAASSPKKAAVDSLLVELVQLRASHRLLAEKKEAERLRRALEALEDGS
jgi:serine/threonine-protein kinase